MEVKNVDELWEILKENTLMIYGTGFVGKRFYHILHQWGLKDRVDTFVTTQGNCDKLFGKSIKAVNEILPLADRCVICVAVTHAAFGEIEKILKELHVENFVWVFPYLYELMFGKILDVGVSINLADIWRANRERMGIPVRYLAMEEYYGRNKIGYAIYKKVMNLCSTEETTNTRLIAYRKMLDHESESGCLSSEPISIMKNDLIVDGLHRTSMAMYRGKRKIVANVYPNSHSYVDDYLKYSNPYMDDATIFGLTSSEIMNIKMVQQKLDDIYD